MQAIAGRCNAGLLALLLHLHACILQTGLLVGIFSERQTLWGIFQGFAPSRVSQFAAGCTHAVR